MNLGLRDKVVLVAGASRGIGRATALALAAEGCQLALAARGEDDLRRAAGLRRYRSGDRPPATRGAE